MGRRRGLTTGETLAILLVLILFFAIVVPVYLRTRNRDRLGEDALAMRRVYVGISMYQEDYQGAMPGSLAELGDRVDRDDLQSPLDPFVGTAKEYPIEPMLPDAPGTVPYRVSDAYLGNFIRLGKSPYKTWHQVPSLTGVLANVWQGDVVKNGRFKAVTQGPVLRIRMDGSLFKLSNRRNPQNMGDFADLFTRTK